MKSTLQLLLGIILSLSIVFTGAGNLAAEIVRGEVKQAAPEAQLFTLRTNGDKVLLISWDGNTSLTNLKDPAAIKAADYLIVDFTRNGEQLLATALTEPVVTLPAGIGEVSFATVDQFAAGSSGKQTFILIDTRPAEKYHVGHIPGARSIPLERIAKRTAGLLPDDKDTALVYYDDGAEVDAAVKAAELTSRNGYTRVLVFKEGVRGWLKAGRFLASSATFIRKKKPVVIDLRAADKVQQGHLEGAANMPLAELDRSYGNFPLDKNTPVVVYGDTDKESLAGAAIIKNWGYKNVTILKGGVAGWSESAEALETGPAADQIYSDAASHSGQLRPEDFKLAVISTQTVEIVDVRSDAEYLKGHLSTGLHLPLKNLAVRYKELSDRKIQVVFAADIERAEIAYDFLKGLGYRVNYLGGAVEFGKDGAYTVK